MPRFVSADPSAPLPGDIPAPAPGAEPSAEPPAPAPGIRTPAAGPKFASLGGGRLLSLNRYRGLQVIDLSNPATPRIDGELPLNAFGLIAVYAAGERAFVLVDGLRQQQPAEQAPDPAAATPHQASALLAVDLHDPSAPRIEKIVLLPGAIRASQLVAGEVDGVDRAMLVVASDDESSTPRTVLQSFDVTRDALTPLAELDLGNYVGAIRATPESVLVARFDSGPNSARSSILLVDIGTPGAELRLGGPLRLAGYVPDSDAMDLEAGVLRAVSIARGSRFENHLETFDVADMAAPVAIAHCRFGAGGRLRTVAFAGTRGLFVTDDSSAPHHPFVLAADGTCTERSEYGLMPGWDDRFRFVNGGDLLLAVGPSTGGMAVTLYDSATFTAASPGLERIELPEADAWTEVSWDLSGLSVLEDAIAPAPSRGARGTLLLPYTARDAERRYLAGVQAVAFSDAALEPRGTMEHGSMVTHSLAADARTTANLSDSELSLWSREADRPSREVGRLEVAPNYASVFAYGDYLARIHLPAGQPDLDPNDGRPFALEVTRGADPEGPAATASFPVHPTASLHQVGDLLVSVTSTGPGRNAGNARTSLAAIDVYDLGDPAEPVLAGSLDAELSEGDIRGGDGAARSAIAMPDALVLPSQVSHEEFGGSRQICTSRPDAGCQQVERGGALVRRCFSGAIQCVQLDEDPPRCLGEIQECDGAFANCGPVMGFLPSSQNCTREYVKTRWTTLTFDIIDLRDPAYPGLTRLQMPESEHGLGAFASGSDLYYTFKRPVVLPDDPRSYAAYQYKRIDLSDPAYPRVQAEINLPGELLAVRDGALYSRDHRWHDGLDPAYDTTLHRVSLDGTPIVEASTELGVSKLANLDLDGGGSLSYLLPGEAFVIADATSLRRLSSVEVTGSQRVQAVRPGRAVLTDLGSLSIIDFTNPEAASFSAHHLVRGWNSGMAWVDDDLFVATGPYGLQHFSVAGGGEPAPAIPRAE
jgi:hypothetical protein